MTARRKTWTSAMVTHVSSQLSTWGLCSRFLSWNNHLQVSCVDCSTPPVNPCELSKVSKNRFIIGINFLCKSWRKNWTSLLDMRGKNRSQTAGKFLLSKHSPTSSRIEFTLWNLLQAVPRAFWPTNLSSHLIRTRTEGQTNRDPSTRMLWVLRFLQILMHYETTTHVTKASVIRSLNLLHRVRSAAAITILAPALSF